MVKHLDQVTIDIGGRVVVSIRDMGFDIKAAKAGLQEIWSIGVPDEAARSFHPTHWGLRFARALPVPPEGVAILGAGVQGEMKQKRTSSKAGVPKASGGKAAKRAAAAPLEDARAEVAKRPRQGEDIL